MVKNYVNSVKYVKIEVLYFIKCIISVLQYYVNVIFFVPGVSLTIPEGALPDDCSETVYLAVCRDDRDRPKLTGNSEPLTSD